MAKEPTAGKLEWYFDFLHSFIVITAVLAWAKFIKLDFDIKAELIVMRAVQGFGIGALISFVWEFLIEELILKMKASRKDVINMCASGTVAGLATAFFTTPIYVVVPMLVASVIFVVVELRKFYKKYY